MSKRIKVMSVFGTRPEAIKMAPLVLELQKHPELESIVCITAQHREMLDSVMDCFGIRADYDLNIMQQGQDLTAITTRVLERMREVLSEVQPDIVLVHGDTTTTFAGALAAFYAKIPVGHVEAGLRTYDRWSPFPEEMNRSLVGRIATLHFAPTANNAHNLEREAVEGDIFVTGNTVIDAMAYTVRGEQFVSDELQQVDFSRRVITMTCHRRENYGQPMRNIFTAVRRLALNYPDVEIVYPVHLSPVVRSTAEELLGGVPNIRLIAPLDAVDMHRLMARSYMVMTDSGGIQEEAPALGKPVLVLRRETERPEAVTAGTVKLAGTNTEGIYRLAAELLDDPAAYDRMAKAVNPYGDGKALPAHRAGDPEPFSGRAAARAVRARALKKQHPAEDEQQLLVAALAVHEIQHQNQQQVLTLEVRKRKFLQQLLQAAAGQARGGLLFPPDGAAGAGGSPAAVHPAHARPGRCCPDNDYTWSSPSRSSAASSASDASRARLHGAVDLAPALLGQIRLHGLEQVAVGGVVSAAAQRRHHPAQLPHVEVEIWLRCGRRR